MRNRDGFTLIELIATLAISGLSILGGVLLLDQLTGEGSRIAAEGARIAGEGNGQRLLRRLLVDAMTSTDSTKRFLGSASSLEFWTNCDAARGWAERCQVRLAIDTRQDSSIVFAIVSSGDAYAVLRNAGPSEFRYFKSLRADTAWVRQWSSNVVLPLAIGLVVTGDTIVLPVGVAQ